MLAADVWPDVTIRPPEVSVWTNATSNLDNQTERLIQTALRELLQDRTAIVIAHRLGTITEAGQIVVIEEGEVVEAGTHDELLLKAGRYRDMVHLQMQEGTAT